jgi:hypothetical protein
LQEFSSLPKERLKKVLYVEGDLTKPIEHCGLLLTSHVSLVFHIAASVSFQDTMLGTIKMNALPVIEVV